MYTYTAFLFGLVVKNLPTMQKMLEMQLISLGWEDPWRRAWQHTAVFLGFPGGSDSQESVCNVGDVGSIPELGRSSGERNGNLHP